MEIIPTLKYYNLQATKDAERPLYLTKMQGE